MTFGNATWSALAQGDGTNWWDIDPITVAWTLAVALTVNLSCAILGCFLVVRRMSLLGDAISHAVLPGLVIAFLLAGRIASGPMFVGATLAGLFTAWASRALASTGRVRDDASLGIVFTTMFALGVVFIHAYADNVDLDPGCVLYGSIELTSLERISLPWPGGGTWSVPRALFAPLLALCATLILVSRAWNELVWTSFDPGHAAAAGLNVERIHQAFLVVTAATTVASFEAVGSILVVAMLIVPAACARLLTSRLEMMIILACFVGAFSAVGGFVLAAALDTNMAGMTAGVAGGFFALAVVGSPSQGVVARVWRRVRLTARIADEDVLAWLYRADERGRIARVSELPDRATAGGSALRNALGRLIRQGQVRRGEGDALHLTQGGREAGKAQVRAHRLWESYLDRHFDLPLDHLHDPAEEAEHYLGPDLQRQILAELGSGSIDADPHGATIPLEPGLQPDRRSTVPQKFQSSAGESEPSSVELPDESNLPKATSSP